MANLVFETFISAQDAYTLSKQGSCVFVDCSYSLQDADWGYKSYLENHIPDAHFVNLNTEMSSTIIPGRTGRHPLPSEIQIKQVIQRLGIQPTIQIIAYDQQNGASAAARFWWLLKWAGHKAVAVLEGGKQEWASHYPLTSQVSNPLMPSQYTPKFDSQFWVDRDFILNHLGEKSYITVDARASNRFRGEIEPIDPVAGHIPGAENVPYLDLLNENGGLKPKESIIQKFDKIRNTDPENLIFYCGSGVTACFNILLYHHAFGGKLPKLYPGSWSDWVVNYPERPIEKNHI